MVFPSVIDRGKELQSFTEAHYSGIQAVFGSPTNKHHQGQRFAIHRKLFTRFCSPSANQRAKVVVAERCQYENHSYK
jgi:hypothetical protein